MADLGYCRGFTMKKYILFIIFFLIMNNAFADEISIIFKNDGNESLDDSLADSSLPNNNYGTLQTLDVNKLAAEERRGYFTFALNSSIFNEVNFTRVTFSITSSSTIVAAQSKLFNISIYEVNDTWDETSITWNNQPCGTSFNSNIACNLTAESTSLVNSTLPNQNVTWNITNMVTRALREGRGQISFVLKINDSNNSDAFKRLRTKEDPLNQTWGPFINFSFTTIIGHLRVNIFKEGTSQGITDEVNAEFISPTKVFNVSTSTSIIDFNFNQNRSGTYTVKFSSIGYTTRYYNITLIYPSSENTNLSVYLFNSTTYQDVTFTFLDSRTATVLEGVQVIVYSRIGTDYILIDNKFSDIVGNILFTLNPDSTYRFVLIKSGFSTKTFDLEPNEASYTISMIPEISSAFTTFYNQVDYIIYATSNAVDCSIAGSCQKTSGNKVNSSVVEFSFTTVPYSGNSISYYGMNTTFRGVTYKNNISSNVGGTTSITFNLTNVSGINIPFTYFFRVVTTTGTLINNTIILDREYNIINYSYYAEINNTLVIGTQYLRTKISSGYMAVIEVFLIIIIMATFVSIGVSGLSLNLIAGVLMGFLGFMLYVPPLNPTDNILFSFHIIALIVLGGSFFIARSPDGE